jgi:hypothetical protein
MAGVHTCCAHPKTLSGKSEWYNENGVPALLVILPLSLCAAKNGSLTGRLYSTLPLLIVFTITSASLRDNSGRGSHLFQCESDSDKKCKRQLLNSVQSPYVQELNSPSSIRRANVGIE